MSQKERILLELRRQGGAMSLGHALQFPWGYKLTSRISDLRKEGHKIVCEKGKRPSENVYRLLEQDPEQLRLV